MIQNKNMTRAAKKRSCQARITLGTAALQPTTFVDPENNIRILTIRAVHTVANDSATIQPIEVGTTADYDHYATFSITASKSAGDVETVTVLNPTDVLAAGTPLFIRRANTTAGANTAVVDVIVHYEIVDRSSTNRP